MSTNKHTFKSKKNVIHCKVSYYENIKEIKIYHCENKHLTFIYINIQVCRCKI